MSDDLISRQAAIALAYFHGETATWDNPMPDGIYAVDVSDLEALPSAYPEQKQIPQKLKIETLECMIQGYSYMDKCCVCPSCGTFRGNLDYEPYKIKKYSYCPDCGQALDWSDIK